MSMKMQSNVPAQKVNGATIGAALSQILLWGLSVAFPELDIPEGIELAVTTVMTFLAGYFTPPASRDQIVNS